MKRTRVSDIVAKEFGWSEDTIRITNRWDFRTEDNAVVAKPNLNMAKFIADTANALQTKIAQSETMWILAVLETDTLIELKGQIEITLKNREREQEMKW